MSQPKNGSRPPDRREGETPSAEPPREMTRDERRLIFAKLDEVYLDERRGYQNGYSDKVVAENLGVPRAWVSIVRDQNFGPENSNEAARQLVAEAKATSERAQKLCDEFDGIGKKIRDIKAALEAVTLENGAARVELAALKSDILTIQKITAAIEKAFRS